MLAHLRYVLATFCFAASVACLALWWRSIDYDDLFSGPSVVRGELMYLNAIRGKGVLATQVYNGPIRWRYSSRPRVKVENALGDNNGVTRRNFGMQRRDIFWRISFPLWYPALIFALAGVGIMRVGRFMIRSALIATTIVALLLGMVVVL